MRPGGATRAVWLAAAAIVMGPGVVNPARAACTYNSVAEPSGVFALSGDVCAAAPGTYIPTFEPDVALPVEYTGFGFFASNQIVDDDEFRAEFAGPGGIINAAGGVTILTGAGEALYANAYGAWSQGAGSQINFGGETTIGTAGAGSAGLYANGGAITATAPITITTIGPDANGVTADAGGKVTLNGGSVTVSGAGSLGLYATGAGSRITANDLTISTSSGPYNSPVYAHQGGQITVNGGSATSTGASSFGVAVVGGGTINIDGTTILTTGPGSAGMIINGTGGAIAATGVSVTTQGGVDPDLGNHADGAYNGSYGTDYPGGGILTIANSSIATSGTSASGVVTANGGSTTIAGGSISTAGNAAWAVTAASGALVKVSGTTIATTGDGSGGLSVNGAGSELDATGVMVTTKGGRDAASGLHAYGLFNGPSGDVTSGGVASLSNSAISTLGDGSHGVVTGAGGTTTLVDTNVSTAGAGAIGVLAYGGGATRVSGGSIATAGANAYGVNADGAGSKVNLASTTITTSGAGAIGLFASDRAATGSAGTIMATWSLDIQTKSASAAAVAVQGNGATVTATGGGTITAAGNAIAFLGGTGQSATFDNFNITSLSGDLAFADPSFATLNFNAVTANAGAGNLLNATAGSAITFNANASMLTGAIQTDAASTTNVNLTNGTTWNLTASSILTNLSLAHSIVVFAPPGAGGGFKTLTVNNYVGNGANITMNVALGGSGSAGDRIVVNGGKATGSTLLTINNVGGPGGQTSGAGIPVVMATNGGAIAANAFSLANMPIAGGYRYTLDQAGDAWYLVSSPTATVAGLASSINSIARAQQSQMITNRVLGSLLLGATQQISCSSCGGGFASIGSFALGGSGRWSLSDNLTLLGGISYNQWSASGITVYNAPTVAGALLYDFVNWGKSRPFLEIGAGLTPYEQVNTSRVYPNGLTTGYGYSSAIDRQASLFGRAGWVDRLTPIDEAAAYADLGRSWMQTGGYSEQATAINPFPATVANGLATLNTVRIGAQYTHLFNGNIETNVGAAVAYGFGAGSGAPFNILQFGTLAPGAIGDSAWFEYGARVGYRVTNRVVVDAFVLGTAGGLAGNFVHGGLGVRLAF